MSLVSSVHVVLKSGGLKQSAGGGGKGVEVGSSALPKLRLVETDNNVHDIGGDETDGSHAHEGDGRSSGVVHAGHADSYVLIGQARVSAGLIVSQKVLGR